jgi:S1-C subfamily serine protease
MKKNLANKVLILLSIWLIFSNQIEGVRAVRAINVVKVSSIKLDKNKVIINVGESIKLNVKFNPINVTNKKVQWKSDNSKVAKVDQNGVVTALSNGSAFITVTTLDGLKSANSYIEVETPVSGVTLDKKTVTLKVSQSLTLKAQVKPASATNKNLVWTSSNSKVVTVDSNGKLKGLKSGTAKVIVTTVNGNKKASIEIKVIPKKLTAKEIFSKSTNAVGYVECYGADDQVVASGSGFLIDKNGTFLTNFHVIYDSETPISYVNIEFGDGEIFENVTDVSNYDQGRDIAELKISGAEKRPYLKLGDDSKLVTGETVFAIGSPYGLENTISQGIVSSKSREIDGYNFIQISVPIDHGSSGGALINEFGEVVGITSAGFDSNANLNLAIPISDYYFFNNESTTISELNGSSEETYTDNALLEGSETLNEKEPNGLLEDADTIKYFTTYYYGELTDSNDLDTVKFTLTDTRKVTVVGNLLDDDNYLNDYFMFGILDSSGTVLKVSYSGNQYESSTYPYNSYYAFEIVLEPGTYSISFLPDVNYAYYFDLRPRKYGAGIYIE